MHIQKPFKTLLIIILSTICISIATRAQEKEYRIIVSTNYGDMTIKLYNTTPNHRDNFLKLAQSGHFDGTLFYRVIKNFVIQGGSSDSRNAPSGKHIGYGNSKMVIDSEFKKENIHKKGALCAPRQPDQINHFQMSDISQFYIVHGKKYTNDELDLLEKARNNPIKIALKKKYYLPYKDELKLIKTENPKAYNSKLREIKQNIELQFQISNKLIFTDVQRKYYTTIGGLPDLDDNYTVFGEVIKGIGVIDKIATIKTDANDRPIKDVIIKVKVIND